MESKDGLYEEMLRRDEPILAGGQKRNDQCSLEVRSSKLCLASLLEIR